jgi:hypothetical protein
MNFLYPVFLVGAVAAAIPIVLHFLRRDAAPDVPFSAVRLLRGSPVPQSEPRRLRDLLLLAARVLALLLLAAAFARPYLTGAAAGLPRVRIVAIDRSFSMGAPGRFPEALGRARAAVDEVPGGERVAVIAFDDRADVIAEPGTPAEARAALSRVEPSFGGTRYAPLFEKASSLAGSAGGRLVVITDLQRSGWEDQPQPALEAGLQLEVRDSGAPPANLAVVGLRADPDRIVASIRNTGRDLRTGQLHVQRDGHVVGTHEYRAAGASVTDVVIPSHAPAGGSLSASIEDPEGFAADNARFLVPDAARHDGVLVVAGGSGQPGFYFAQALRARSAAPVDAASARARDAAALSTGDLSSYGAVVLLSTRGLERRGREAIAGFVRSGGGVLVAASPDVEPAVLATMFDVRAAFAGLQESASAVSLSVTDLRHPIFRPFGALSANLGQVRFDRVWRLRPEGWDVAARFTDGTPALLERAEGSGRVVLFASDLDRRWNDFPVQPSFVPFVLEAVRYVSGTREGVSDYLVSSVPDGVPARPGVYRSGNHLVAVNVDERESDPARVSPEEFAAMVATVPSRSTDRVDLQARQAEARQSYWQYGLLLMIGALVAESLVGRA